MSELSRQAIRDGAPALPRGELARLLEGLPGWQLSEEGAAIFREWRFGNFARAAQLANLAAWQAEAAGHHPDIAFGWGYVRVGYATHSAGGVTMNDLIMAARLDAAAG